MEELVLLAKELNFSLKTIKYHLGTLTDLCNDQTCVLEKYREHIGMGQVRDRKSFGRCGNVLILPLNPFLLLLL